MQRFREFWKQHVLKEFIILGALVMLLACGNSVVNGGDSSNTPQATAVPKTWQTVQTFTGNGSKKTATFTVGDKWRIVWSCDPSSFSGDQYNIIIEVDNDDGSALDVGAVSTMCKPSNTTGDSEERKGGAVYLDIISEADWTIQVQEFK